MRVLRLAVKGSVSGICHGGPDRCSLLSEVQEGETRPALRRPSLVQGQFRYVFRILPTSEAMQSASGEKSSEGRDQLSRL